MDFETCLHHIVVQLVKTLRIIEESTYVCYMNVMHTNPHCVQVHNIDYVGLLGLCTVL